MIRQSLALTVETVASAAPTFLKVPADSVMPYLMSSNINCKVKRLAIIEFVRCADVPC